MLTHTHFNFKWIIRTFLLDEATPMRQRLAWVLCTILFAVPAYAQNGSVTGTVVDASGGVVPGAIVSLTGQAGSQSATTGPTGEYRFTNVSRGHYSISVLMPGFAAAGRNDLTVASSQLTVPPIVLAGGGMGATVVGSASKVQRRLVA